MIITENMEIKIIPSIIKYYKSKGYICNVGDTIIVKIKDIPINSHLKINVECDICKKENKTTYNNYTKLLNRYNTYRCKDCGISYRKKVFIDKYGVDNPTKSKIISNKISLTYQLKSEDEKIKMIDNQKKTIFDKYGDWFTKSDLYRNKIKITSLERYGLNDYRSSDFFKNKVKNTLVSVYRVNNAFELHHVNSKALFGNKINRLHIKSQLKYQGTYELDFIEKYFKILNISKIKTIKYIFKGYNKTYQPDFYIPDLNLIVEIKSTYTYNYELEKNLEKKAESIKKGFNFIFIIDKDYTEFEKLIKVYHDVT